MKVNALGPSEVEVTWRPLDSQDIAGYRVYYRIADSVDVRRQAGGEELRMDFPAESASGVVGGLEEGEEYTFEVVAVVTVSGLDREGDRSPPSVVEVGGVRRPDDELGSSEIAGIILAAIVLVIIIFVSIFIGIAIWYVRLYQLLSLTSHAYSVFMYIYPLGSTPQSSIIHREAKE